MKNGFTLVEVLLYIAFLSVIMTSLLFVGFHLLDASKNIDSNLEEESESNFLIRKIIWELNNANAVENPPPNSESSVLDIKNGGVNIIFKLIGNNLTITRGAGNPETILNNSKISISDLNFKHLAEIGNKPAAIETSFKTNGKPFMFIQYIRNQ